MPPLPPFHLDWLLIVFSSMLFFTLITLQEESKQEATAHQEKRIRRGADEGDTQFLGVVEMN